MPTLLWPQVAISYGPLRADESAIYYGFVVQPAADDVGKGESGVGGPARPLCAVDDSGWDPQGRPGKNPWTPFNGQLGGEEGKNPWTPFNGQLGEMAGLWKIHPFSFPTASPHTAHCPLPLSTTHMLPLSFASFLI